MKMSPVMGHVMQQGGFMDEKIRIYMVVRKNCEKQLRHSMGLAHIHIHISSWPILLDTITTLDNVF